MPIAEVELVNFAALIPTNRVQGKLDAYHVLEPLLVQVCVDQQFPNSSQCSFQQL